MNSREILLLKIFRIVFISITIVYITSQFIQSIPLTLFRFFCQMIGVSVVLIHIGWYLSRIIPRYAQKSYISPTNKAILITGCDAGFGNKICYKLDKYGFHVFAGVLFPESESANNLRLNCSKSLKVVNSMSLM